MADGDLMLWLLLQPQSEMQQSRLPDGPVAPVITLFHPGEPSCDIWLKVGHLREAGHAVGG
jgi:hypothetical protein